MAKRKKMKRRSPKKKADRIEGLVEDQSESLDEEYAAGASSAEGDGDDLVDASLDEDEPSPAVDEPTAEEVAAADESPPKLSGRPVGPSHDPGGPNARVSTAGGLWVMAVVFGLIGVAVVAQFFLA